MALLLKIVVDETPFDDTLTENSDRLTLMPF